MSNISLRLICSWSNYKKWVHYVLKEKFHLPFIIYNLTVNYHLSYTILMNVYFLVNYHLSFSAKMSGQYGTNKNMWIILTNRTFGQEKSDLSGPYPTLVFYSGWRQTILQVKGTPLGQEMVNIFLVSPWRVRSFGIRQSKIPKNIMKFTRDR